MGITYFLDKTVQVRRLNSIGGYKLAYQSASASVPIHIQAASDDKIQTVGGAFGRTYIGWISLDNPVHIEEGDRLQDGTGRVFEVKTINRRDFGINQHQEVIMDRIDEASNK